MKIGISNWNGFVAPLFNVGDRLCVIHVEDGKEIKREHIVIKNRDFFRRANELNEMGIDVLVCGAISWGLETAILNKGIYVISFISGDIESVFEAFIKNRLTIDGFLMPGYARRHAPHRFRHRRGRKTPNNNL